MAKSPAAKRRSVRKKYDAKPDGRRRESKRVNAQHHLSMTLSNMDRHAHTGASDPPGRTRTKNERTKAMARQSPRAYAIGKSMAKVRKVARKHRKAK